MKIAFLCEGYSEYDSICVLLNKLGLFNFQLLKDWNESINREDLIYVYRHNYKGIGKIRKEYLDFSSILIDKAKFDKIFVWFDNEQLTPVCEYAKVQYDSIRNKYGERIELLIAVEILENWFLSNVNILSQLLEKTVDENSLMSENINNFLKEKNVDELNAKRIFKDLIKGTKLESYRKQKISARFFSLINFREQYKSDSFTRFISKMSFLSTLNKGDN